VYLSICIFKKFRYFGQRDLKPVRHFSSIALSFLILLNVLGYYGIFVGLGYKNTQEVTRQLDSDRYDESNTVLIKVPLSIPYAVNTEYERVDGEFNHEGQVYRLVKQKLVNDTLFVVCLKDEKGTAINRALTDYVKTFSDKPADSKSNQKDQFSFVKEYVLRGVADTMSGTYSWERDLLASGNNVVFIDSFSASIVHPPERA
jgi:hypothetical protein